MDAHLINLACEKALAQSFIWGEHDCCTFVCDALLAATGSDPMAHLRGTYKNEIEAKSALGGLRFVGGVIDLAHRGGFLEVEFPYADADFGIVTTNRGPALALCFDGKFVARAETGIVQLPARCGAIAWSIA